MRYVTPLSEKEIEKLNNINKYDSSFRTRSRAHAVILSDRGYRIDDIADIFGVDRDTVDPWILSRLMYHRRL